MNYRFKNIPSAYQLLLALTLTLVMCPLPFAAAPLKRSQTKARDNNKYSSIHCEPSCKIGSLENLIQITRTIALVCLLHHHPRKRVSLRMFPSFARGYEREPSRQYPKLADKNATLASKTHPTDVVKHFCCPERHPASRAGVSSSRAAKLYFPRHRFGRFRSSQPTQWSIISGL